MIDEFTFFIFAVTGLAFIAFLELIIEHYPLHWEEITEEDLEDEQ